MLVREVLRRHLEARPERLTPAPALDPHRHPSHWQFAVPRGADADGPCLIEPVVACVHCGYCRSWGH